MTSFLSAGAGIILVISMVIFSGCTGPREPAPPAPVHQTDTPAGTPSVTTSMTPATPPVTAVRVTVTERPGMIFTGEYHWAEYRENITQTLPPNPRYQWENSVRVGRSSENYHGSPAIHYSVTYTTDYSELVGDQRFVTKNGCIFIDESYYEISTGRLLGQTTLETIKGIPTPAMDSSPWYAKHIREESPGGWLGITPFGEMNITLSDLGTGSVMVPAATYPDARKYSGKFHDGTPITFWVVPGIPVPVQYQYPDKNLDGIDPFRSYELRGWG